MFYPFDIAKDKNTTSVKDLMTEPVQIKFLFDFKLIIASFTLAFLFYSFCQCKPNKPDKGIKEIQKTILDVTKRLKKLETKL